MTALSAAGPQQPTNDTVPHLRGPKFPTVISTYALPPIPSSDEALIRIYEDLYAILATVPKASKLIVFANFNAQIETEYVAWRGLLGPHGLGSCNDNHPLLR
ncbi:unnamed protein product [Schistocephalus solidus]|uniref:Uncharacterized protein n=1 Tax=Schistocephalus solidus TaxID=70667 RepID=A0A183SKC2_SCHSO|nr:unnamed protein product [Schistocephalus solidus]